MVENKLVLPNCKIYFYIRCKGFCRFVYRMLYRMVYFIGNGRLCANRKIDNKFIAQVEQKWKNPIFTLRVD